MVLVTSPSVSVNKKGKSSIFSSSTSDSDSEAESAGTMGRPPTRPPTMPPTPPQPTPPEEPPPPPPSAVRKPHPGEVKIPSLMELFPEFRRMMVGRTDAPGVQSENKVVTVYHMSMFCGGYNTIIYSLFKVVTFPFCCPKKPTTSLFLFKVKTSPSPQQV